MKRGARMNYTTTNTTTLTSVRLHSNKKLFFYLIEKYMIRSKVGIKYSFGTKPQYELIMDNLLRTLQLRKNVNFGYTIQINSTVIIATDSRLN